MARSAEHGVADVAEIPASNKEPESIQGSLEAREWLAMSLRGLSSVDREILSLTIQGYSLSDLAEATGLSYTNAGVRLHRLRKRLRKSLIQR